MAILATYPYRLYLFMTPSSPSPSAIRSEVFAGANLTDGANALHDSMAIAIEATAVMKRIVFDVDRDVVP